MTGSDSNPKQASSKQSCKFCGAVLAAGAVLCTECELYQSWSAFCVVCKRPLHAKAKICPHCDSPQEPSKKCNYCGSYMLVDKRVCPTCHRGQLFRSFLGTGHQTLTVLSLLIALIAAVGPQIKALFADERSETHFELVDIDQDDQGIDTLLILGTNAGTRPAYLKSAKVYVDDPDTPFREMQLVEEPKDRILEPGKQRTFELKGFSVIDLQKFKEIKTKGAEECRDRTWEKKFGVSSLTVEIVGVGEENVKPVPKSDLLTQFLWKRTVNE